MKTAIKAIFILTTILSSSLYADNCQEDLCLTIGNVSDIDNTVEILYTANNDNITNIQFDISNLPITSASGGQGESDGFNYSVGNNTVIISWPKPAG